MITEKKMSKVLAKCAIAHFINDNFTPNAFTDMVWIDENTLEVTDTNNDKAKIIYNPENGEVVLL